MLTCCFMFQLYDLPAALQAVVGLAPPPPATTARHNHLKAKLHAKNISTLPPLPSSQQGGIYLTCSSYFLPVKHWMLPKLSLFCHLPHFHPICILNFCYLCLWQGSFNFFFCKSIYLLTSYWHSWTIFSSIFFALNLIFRIWMCIEFV